MFLIQPASNAFTRHFSQDMMTIDTAMAIVPGKLFDHFYANRKEISGYLFQASNINQEIIEFIQNFKGHTKIYLYFDKFNLQLYNDASSMVKCIVKEETVGSKSASIKQKNTIKVGPMYSENLLYSCNLEQPKSSNEDIIADISDLEKIPEALENILYPNKKLRIKLLNNASINHIQNLGFVDDQTMVSMINECKAYIDTNTNYLLYALILDKPTITLETNSILKKTKEIDESTFANTEGSKLELHNIIKNSYKNFIQKYIL